jgi:hypothetical protein
MFKSEVKIFDFLLLGRIYEDFILLPDPTLSSLSLLSLLLISLSLLSLLLLLLLLLSLSFLVTSTVF